jgi:transposase-like protein
MTGPGGMLKALSKTVIETALDEEMTEHLGYDKHELPAAAAGTPATAPNQDRADRQRRPGPGNVSRDRDSTFDPVIVRKRQRRLGGVDTIVLSLVATGLTTGEFSAHFEEMHEMTEWTARRRWGRSTRLCSST